MILFEGKIPVSIQPIFWLFAALIGWLNSQTVIGTLVWIAIIFVSVLIHEYGHALTALAFRQQPSIQLVALGGLTSFQGPKLKFWQQFLIVLNGPLFGFGLFVLASLALKLDWSSTPLLFECLRLTQLANLFWTVLNLLPVLPLDGGQLLRIVLEAFFGVKGFKAALLIGAMLAGALACYFFLIGALLVGALFFLFGFQSFDQWRKSGQVTTEDRDEELRQLVVDAEIALAEGKRSEAKALLIQVRQKVSKGTLYLAATQYLAMILLQERDPQEAYNLLLPIEPDLSEEPRCILHQLAAQFGNWPLVAKLSVECYQIAPTQEMALNNARAFAHLKEGKHAGGWLQTASQYGSLDIEKILLQDPFQSIKDDPDFKSFNLK